MPIKTLIVEDDQSFLKLLQLRLKNWQQDIDITCADSLCEARAVLNKAEQPFHLIILDQHLPDGDSASLFEFEHPALQNAAVLAVSNDLSPTLPGQALRAGAQHFLGKLQIREPLFIPLVEALIDRKKIEKELFEARLKQSRLETIKRLLATLRHEINNPLGAVIGGAYLMRSTGQLGSEQTEALRLIESSANRINHVLRELCETAELEEVVKGEEPVYQVPGDKAWQK